MGLPLRQWCQSAFSQGQHTDTARWITAHHSHVTAAETQFTWVIDWIYMDLRIFKYHDFCFYFYLFSFWGACYLAKHINVPMVNKEMSQGHILNDGPPFSLTPLRKVLALDLPCLHWYYHFLVFRRTYPFFRWTSPVTKPVSLFRPLNCSLAVDWGHHPAWNKHLKIMTYILTVAYRVFPNNFKLQCTDTKHIRGTAVVQYHLR